MSGFRVALPNPDAVDGWMVKNRLYPIYNKLHEIVWTLLALLLVTNHFIFLFILFFFVYTGEKSKDNDELQ